jgi:hypothetical protein
VQYQKLTQEVRFSIFYPDDYAPQFSFWLFRHRDDIRRGANEFARLSDGCR